MVKEREYSRNLFLVSLMLDAESSLDPDSFHYCHYHPTGILFASLYLSNHPYCCLLYSLHILGKINF